MTPLTTVYYLVACLFLFAACSTNPTQVESPDGQIRIVLDAPLINDQDTDGGISYRVYYRGQEVVGDSELGLEFRNSPDLDSGLTLIRSKLRMVDETWERVWGRNKIVRDHYNELSAYLEDRSRGLALELILRVYNDGLAIRYHIPEQAGIDEFELSADRTRFTFKDNQRVWAVHYGSFHSHQESEFNEMFLDDPRMKEVTGLPLLIQVGSDIWLAITEADLTDWAGMYLRRLPGDEYSLETVLAPWPDDPGVLVTSRTPRNSPWRVIMIGDSPGDFIESDIIANLNDPNCLEDVSWIQPGKSAWDWWWCNSYGPEVDFEMGPNTETMKHFIDLAADMGWEYQLVDWKWYGPAFVEGTNDPHPESDITTMIPGIDIPELVRYGKDRGVRILLWLEWNHADRKMEEAFPLYEKWGVAGVKVDFMTRDDQYVVNFYHRLVKKAAEHHLLVDFHGAYKPTGVSRTLPNLLTREGVMGNEYVKWSHRITPKHKVTIPFTRGMLGEMDFTPGAFINVTEAEFKTEDEAPSPMTMGTRCNELSMMVVYESALAVLCDAPYNYRNSPAGTDFLEIVPTTWDETRVINASVGNYITTARRSGPEWFVGSMTGSRGRTLQIPLDFLDEGRFRATVWKDSEDAEVHPANLVREELIVDNKAILDAVMAPGGGHVIHIKPQE